MSDPMPITNDELDALEQGFGSPPSSDDPVRLWEIVLKLCRAGVRLTRELRAERAEVERLTTRLERVNLACDVFEKNSANAAELFEENIGLCAENARLRERLAALEAKEPR